MRLGGWQRVWVVLSVTYTSAVIIYLFVEFPKPEDILDISAIHSYMADQNVKKISNDSHEDVLGVEMPNGDVLYFVSSLPEKEVEKVAGDYYQAMVKVAKDNQRSLLIQVLLFWIIPIVLLYIFGWTVGWIYRGFKQSDQ